MKEKTYVDDVDRSIYDIRNEEKDVYRVQEGLDASIVEKISKEKNDPAWMTMFRLQSLQIYNELKVPDWGPSIDGLDMSHIATYVRPNTKMSAKWSEVPEDIKDTFEKLGIPQAERKSLAGVGAQYDSELVYHNVREEVAAQGVVYTDMDEVYYRFLFLLPVCSFYYHTPANYLVTVHSVPSNTLRGILPVNSNSMITFVKTSN